MFIIVLNDNVLFVVIGDTVRLIIGGTVVGTANPIAVWRVGVYVGGGIYVGLFEWGETR